MRTLLAHVPKGQNSIAAAALRQAFLQPDAEAAHQTFRHVADQMRERWPKLAAFMDSSEHDVLASMGFPQGHAVLPCRHEPPLQSVGGCNSR
jgi:putative transposase